MSTSANKVIASAPGRLDVMGGIADYSGSLLLQMPIAEETVVELEAGDDGVFHVITDADVTHPRFTIALREIRGLGLREQGLVLRSLPGGDWAAYVLGCFSVLEDAKGLQWNGATIHVRSGVPAGKGVSSSAAIEVATMHAICRAYGLALDPLELSLLAQTVENVVVGAACGLMDQLSVNLGKKDHLLPIICQPHEVMEPIPIRQGLRFYGLDSGVRHAVGGASYGDVRTAAFMGYVIAMKEAGLDIGERPYGGFIANIALDEFMARFQPLLPELITGQEYLDRYAIHIDPVTTVNAGSVYRPRACATHPVMENHRIRIFYEGLSKSPLLESPLLESLGDLMLGSHEGYNSVGLGEPVTNRIVDLVKAWGKGHGIEGARISGGGSGGTVVMMVSSDEGYEVMLRIKATMEAETGKNLKLFEGSSDGANYRY